MSILVTGGAGYIGSHTVHQLIHSTSINKLRESIIVIDNLTTGNRWAVPKEATFIEGDIQNEALLTQVIRMHKVHTVVHFAGSIQVGESVRIPLKYYQNNTVNSYKLIQVCTQENVKQFVFSSTAAVYGDPKELPVSEEAPLIPLSPYGTSKLMTECMLRDVSNSNKDFRYVALRYFNVAGAQIEGNLGQVVENATHLIKVASETIIGKRQKMAIFGTDYPTPDGTGIRDYIHVEDLALAHLDAIKYLSSGGDSEVMNCGYGHGFSVKEVVAMMKKVSETDFNVFESSRRPGDSPAVIAKADKIRNILGWTPKYDSLELICRTALNWEKKLASSGKQASNG